MECGQKDKSDGIRRETGLKPLNDFRLKAGLRRDGSPAQTSPSEYRLQPEACEGLQARVHGSRALCRVKRLPATVARLAMRPVSHPGDRPITLSPTGGYDQLEVTGFPV